LKFGKRSIDLPVYIQQKSAPGSGNTSAAFSAKHAIYYNQQWMFAVDGGVIIPGGSAAYGNKGWTSVINGVANYTINDSFALSGMLGFSKISNSALAGGGSFNSINPDILLSYAIGDKISIYGEVYGQSKTGIDEGAGYNFNGGMLFAARPNIVWSLSGEQQIYNYPGGFTHCINLGLYMMV